jgi:hypothetical protein
MAYKTLISGSSKALTLEKKGQFVEGFLVGCKTGIGKFESTILHFKTDKGPVDVWSNNRVDSVVLAENGKTLSGKVAGKMVKLTCENVREERKGKKVSIFRDFRVEVDETKKLSKNGS